MSDNMLEFKDIREYVEMWCATKNVGLRNIHTHHKAYASPAHGNHLVVGGIGFTLWLDGRPVGERQLMQLCCADSHADGAAASANQIKCALTRWLWDASKSMVNEETTANELFDWRPAFVRQD